MGIVSYLKEILYEASTTKPNDKPADTTSQDSSLTTEGTTRPPVIYRRTDSDGDSEQEGTSDDETAEQEGTSDDETAEQEGTSDDETVETHKHGHVPTRYQELWKKANELAIDDSEVKSLRKYHPETVRESRWDKTLEELEDFVNNLEQSDRDATVQVIDGRYQWIKSNQGEIKNRLKAVVATEESEQEIRNLIEDENKVTNWLEIWAKWESLRQLPEKPRESVSVSEIKGIGKSLSRNLKANGYTSLRDIRQSSVTALQDVEGIGEQRAETIYAWVSTRPVSEIRGVGTTLQKQLHSHGLWTAADITAISQDKLTNINRVGDKRAKEIQARAAAWLPTQCESLASLRQEYQPPYHSLSEATEQIEEFETKLYYHTKIEPLNEVLEREAAPLTISDNRDVYELLVEHDWMSQQQESHKSIDANWDDILQQLIALGGTDNWEAKLSVDLKSHFNLPALQTPQIDLTEIYTKESAEAAERYLDNIKTRAERNREFKRISREALDLQTRARDSSIELTDIEETLSNQLRLLHAHLDDDSFTEIRDTIETYLMACERGIQLTEAYPDYPFASVVKSLIEIGQTDNLQREKIEDLATILEVGDKGFELLETLEYDHPAVDQDAWEESITLALEEQYPQAIQPVEKQLTRLESGVWNRGDLEDYDWRSFEKLVGTLYRDEGYEVTVTQSSGDLGVDIWATNESQRLAIQVKHYQAGQTVGRGALQKLVSTLAKGDADIAVIITSSDFADTAEQYAEDFGPELELVAVEELLERLSTSNQPPEPN
jgi:predicted flap endonuclease-1-like 5' DNA nuclease